MALPTLVPTEWPAVVLGPTPPDGALPAVGEAVAPTVATVPSVDVEGVSPEPAAPLPFCVAPLECTLVSLAMVITAVLAAVTLGAGSVTCAAAVLVP